VHITNKNLKKDLHQIIKEIYQLIKYTQKIQKNIPSKETYQLNKDSQKTKISMIIA